MQKKILIVDDEPMIREILKETFEMAGYHVEEAENGREAFKQIQHKAYDCVLSDVRMPGGDGLELARNIFERVLARPGVFLITGFSEVSIEKTREWGVLQVFEKPFDLRVIVKAVEDAIVTGPRACLQINQNTKI
jgi:DNA-binding NtrC family response regulator